MHFFAKAQKAPCKIIVLMGYFNQSSKLIDRNTSNFMWIFVEWVHPVKASLDAFVHPQV